MSGTVVHGDNLEFLRTLPSESVQLIYVDPPFNTGSVQRMRRVKSRKAAAGTKGFGVEKYVHEVMSDMAYADTHSDYITTHLGPRLVEAHRVLSEDGTLYLHLDYREVHYAKVFLDGLFGRECFLNEIIWSYDFGGRGKRCFPKKHDNILVYVKDPERYTFNYDDIDRVPYMAPDLAGAAKAARGKFPTDVWWQTIVPTNSKERTGYPTQKPIQLARRIITASSSPGRTVLDFYGGSGTVGEASEQLRRDWILVDTNDAAIDVMRKRFARVIPAANINYTTTQNLIKDQTDNEQEEQPAGDVEQEGPSS
jgi:site-specific DNA-methyltransferase (adenine-specific)